MTKKTSAAIDQIGEIDAKIKALKSNRADLIETISGLEAGKHEGLVYRATIVEKVDWRLDTKAVKIEMGEPWYNERCKQSLSRAVRITSL